MPRFAANLSMLYPEVDFLQRFEAAARDGFQGVEYLFPYAYPAEQLADCLQASGQQQVLFNAPPGDWAAGDRGLACVPGREAEFAQGIEQALHYARVLGCQQVHVMAGCVPEGVSVETAQATYVRNLQRASCLATEAGVCLLMEPINRRDMPGYFLTHQAQAHALWGEIGSEHVAVQMDLYHVQVTEGDVATKLRQYLPSGRVRHLQIAGVPERHEPDVGELHYPYLFTLIDALGYPGWVGCEYRPRAGATPGGTTAGLAWRCRGEGAVKGAV